jgi:hypothetical protein
LIDTERRWLVALPAKDEVERLPGALTALDAAARGARHPVAALVLANNCLDETHAVATAVAARLDRLMVAVRSVELAPGLAHAGGARVTAMNAAFAAFAMRRSDLLLTTDADARLAADALARMERAFAMGADVVLAKIECAPDPFDPVTEAALAWGTPQVLWRHKVRQLAETIRTGAVPWPPLHDDYGAAGIACTAAAYERIGGFRAVPNDEDKTFVAAADRLGLAVDRQSGAVVEVLTRATGRATGGMAAALARNAEAARVGLPCLVERHDLTAARLYAQRSHAAAFADEPADLEPVEDAIAGIDRLIAVYERRSA